MTITAPPTRPLLHCSPKWATRRRPERPTFGGELAGIGAALGQPFMPHQRLIADVGGEYDPVTGLPYYREIIVTVPRQTGKAIDCAVELLTANRGWTTMADVRPGDQVFHPGGYPVVVTFVSEVAHGHDCYRVITTDGRSVVVDADHLWTVTDKFLERSSGPRGARRRWHETVTRTTREMFESGVSRYIAGSRTSVTAGKQYRTNEYRFVLPAQELIKSPDTSLPLDPYLLGAWLGDGSSRQAAIWAGNDDVDEMAAALEAIGARIVSRTRRRTVWRLGFSIGARHKDGFESRCRRLEIWGNKHVPESYLTAGTLQREALLQGLLDTDGSIDAARGTVEFCSAKRELADAVLFLARSLGWRPTLRADRAVLYGKDCGPRFRVCFTPKNTDACQPFRLRRKAARVQARDGGKGRSTLSIAAIEPVESVPVRCIKVDSPDGLFLAGRDLVPTHNTTLFLSWQIHRCTAPRWAHPQRSAFTAQSGKDARDKWLDELFPLIRRSRKLKPLVARIYEGMGNEYIRFHNGSLIRLLSTSTSSGHSKTLHQAVLDEIWHDADGRREQGLRPAMITIADAQALVCSTAGNAASVVLARKVQQGRAAVEADSGHGICYIEFSAPDGWDRADEESYFGFMPALCPDPPCRCGGGMWRHTVTLDAIRSERASMDPVEFDRAYGNIPDMSAAKSGRADLGNWGNCADPGSQVADPVALAFAVAPDSSTSAIAVGGRRADGLGHGELVEYRPGTAGLIGRVLELADRWGPCVLVMNPAGQSGAFEKELIGRGFAVVSAGKDPPPGKRRLQVVSMREYAQACGALTDDVRNSLWRHLGQRELDEAAEDARTRPLADLRAWSWADSPSDTIPLEAVTLARHGFMTHGVTARPSPFALWG